tara:strand:+ start:202 stop:495 length:294 start_codon:yes stop_codon:yes gene_type:complete
MRYLAETKTFTSKDGNTYWASRVEDTDRDVVYIFPLQWGYGNHSTCVIGNLLGAEVGGRHAEVSDYIQRDCKRRDVKAWGTGEPENFNAEYNYYFQD